MAGIAVLVVLVAVIAGRTLIDTATASDFQIVSQRSDIEQASDASASPSTSAADAAHGASGSSASGAGDASPSAAASIFVHVTGCVARPGLVELAEGSRVADAVQAAGGFSEDAQADSVNLARVVQDGEQVAVLSAAQVEAGGQAAQPEAQAAAGAAAGTGAAAGSAAQAGSKVNVNTATAEQLQELPGIGPSTAQKIVAERSSNGPFAAVADLTRVSGIGEKKLASIADLVCV